MTGRLPRPQSLSPGLCVQPAAATHASHCAKVTSYLPAANGCAKVTLRCGPSSGLRPRSLGGDPIMNSPAGTTIISGQSAQSRNTSLGPAASPARLPFSWAADTDSWNRTSRRKAIATRKVGSTIFSTCICQSLGRDINLAKCWSRRTFAGHHAHGKRAGSSRGERGRFVPYLKDALTHAGMIVAGKVADVSEEVLLLSSTVAQQRSRRRQLYPPLAAAVAAAPKSSALCHFLP